MDKMAPLLTQCLPGYLFSHYNSFLSWVDTADQIHVVNLGRLPKLFTVVMKCCKAGDHGGGEGEQESRLIVRESRRRRKAKESLAGSELPLLLEERRGR